MEKENKKNSEETKNIEFEDLNQTVEVDKLSEVEAKELLSKYLEREKDLKNQAQKVNKKVKELKSEADEFKDKWMRSAAEFDNYKKRTAQTRTQSIDVGKTQILLKILPIGDNLERAMKMDIDANTKEGLNLLLRNFNEILVKEGVSEINPEGEKFDPNYHEALMQVEAEEGDESGNVKDVFLKGYKLGDKVIRYAQVRVIS